MPQLSDILEKRKDKKFVKKSYRPWDLSGNNEAVNSDASLTVNSINTQTSILPKSLSNDTNNIGESNEPVMILSSIDSKLPANLEEVHTQQDIVEINIDEVSEAITYSANRIEVIAETNIENIKDIKLDNKQETNREQIENGKATNREQIGSKSENKKGTIREQLDNELGALSLRNRYIKLSGIQRKILDFITEICFSREAEETGPIETEIIADYVNTTYGSIKTSLRRLINKGFLLRLPGRTAKGGFINLKLPIEIREVILELSQKPNPIKRAREIMNTLRDVLDNKKDNNQGYISSNINNTTTTNRLTLDWQKINLEPLKHIGFSQNQLMQLFEKQLNTPEIISESIQHFAYGLENNKKTKEYSNPLNVLMGVLRKGQCWIEPNFESAQDIALRQLVEERKKRKEKQDELVNQLTDFEFLDWERSLNSTDLTEILPIEMINTRMTAGRQSLLRSYFKEKVLIPRLKKEGKIIV